MRAVLSPRWGLRRSRSKRSAARFASTSSNSACLARPRWGLHPPLGRCVAFLNRGGASQVGGQRLMPAAGGRVAARACRARTCTRARACTRARSGYARSGYALRLDAGRGRAPLRRLHRAPHATPAMTLVSSTEPVTPAHKPASRAWPVGVVGGEEVTHLPRSDSDLPRSDSDLPRSDSDLPGRRNADRRFGTNARRH